MSCKTRYNKCLRMYETRALNNNACKLTPEACGSCLQRRLETAGKLS